MEYQNILVSTEGKIATITINRPKALNALNSDTIGELSIAFKALQEDQSVRAIIVTGSGEKAFVAGADIKEFLELDAKQGEELARKGQETLFNVIENTTKPVIAAINGFALGGGLELALACHIRIASNNAKLGLPETTLGLIPGYGGTQRLTQIIGKAKALEAIASAKFYGANEALDLGIVSQITTQENLKETVIALAHSLTKNSSTAIAKAIEAINLYNQPEKGFEKEISSFGSLFSSHDFKEGTTAFVEKRKPNFE